MPHSAMLIVKANEVLGDPRALAGVSGRIAGMTTLLEAVEALDLLEAVDAPHRSVARQAVAALPQAVGRALLAAVSSAASRGVPVVLQWKPGSAVELQVWEAVGEGAGQVGILLISPRASDLAVDASA